MPRWIDPNNNQPFPPEDPESNHRLWIPAEWIPLIGGGREKVPNTGIEVDNRGGGYAPRSWNRPGQRYNLAPTELQARRQASANAEYGGTLVLRRREHVFQLRTPSGNFYDCVINPAYGVPTPNERIMCQCPDELRLRLSGYQNNTVCKHVLMARKAWTEIGSEGLGWCTDAFAEFSGFSAVTVRKMCAEGKIFAVKEFETWSIDPVYFDSQVQEQRGRIVHPTAEFPSFAYKTGNAGRVES